MKPNEMTFRTVKSGGSGESLALTMITSDSGSHFLRIEDAQTCIHFRPGDIEFLLMSLQATKEILS